MNVNVKKATQRIVVAIVDWLKHTYGLPVSVSGWTSWPLYVLVLAIYPVVFLYAFNINEVTIGMLWLPLLVAIIFVSLLMLASKPLLKTWSRVAFWSTLVLAVVYGYGRVMPRLPEMMVKVGEISLGKKSIVAILSLALLGYILYWLSRHHKVNPRAASKVINGLAIVLLGLSIIQIIPVEIGRASKYSDTSASVTANSSKSVSKSDTPDVYLVVFDRYGSNKTLQELYNFDNSAYHRMLEDKGFYVAKDSMTNYPATALSLASSLNMRYHQIENPSTATEATDIYPLLKNNAVAQEFKNHGYKFIQLGSWFWQTAQGDGLADETYSFSQQQKILGLDAFSSKLLSTTMALPVVERLWPSVLQLDYHDSHYRHIEYQMDKLHDIVIDTEAPKFVLMHILVPHEPFVYDADCNYITSQQSKQNTLMQNYLNMVQCANQLSETIINQVRQHSNHDPVIIIQADEGPYPIKNWSKVPDSQEGKATAKLLERFRIQSAYYFPNQDYEQLYQTMSPVNNFRVLFNTLFDQKNQLLPDKNYRSRDSQNKLDFIEITEQLRSRP